MDSVVPPCLLARCWESYAIQHRAGAQGIYVQVRKDNVTMDFSLYIR